MRRGLKTEEFAADKGLFDVIFECASAGTVLKEVFPVLCPRGTIALVEMTCEVLIPINAIVGKEGRINLKPIIKSILPVERAVNAFELVENCHLQVKIQLIFGLSLA